MSSYVLPKVQIHGMDAMYESALKALPEKTTPLVKEQRKSNNAYYSRYGDTLVEKLNNYYSVSKLGCISDLVIFIEKG